MNVADKRISNTNSTPPRAPLAFRVGVVGHRPDRLDTNKLNELAATISTILSAVKAESHDVANQLTSIYDGARPLLRAVSPLAEGTDRIFAERAIDPELDFELCCVLPFPRSEFEKDFATCAALEDNSLSRFRHLLAKATIVFELDGARAEDSEAYGQGGLVVLNQSDLLVVVWDGQRLGKIGGTEDTFNKARNRGVPIAWIDALEPRNWQLLDAATPLPRVAAGQRVAPDGSGSPDAVRELVREALELPKPVEDATKKGHEKRTDPEPALQRFYSEERPRITPAFFWKAFVTVVGDAKWPKVSFRLTNFENAVVPDWPQEQSTPIARLVDRLRPFYAWPDRLAVLYADRYRSAFTFNFLTAATAVGLALLPGVLGVREHPIAERVCIGLELAAILIILVLVVVGRKRYWHERWIDYRLTAELVRHLRMVVPLGGKRPFPQIPAHWVTYGQPGASWMAWYVRAVERWLGLPSAVVDKHYLDDHLKRLEHLVIGQISYHQNRMRRCHNMETRLHLGGIYLLGATLCACGLHLLLAFLDETDLSAWISAILTLIDGFCPAMGAALAAISNQGEFRSLTNRSKAMRERLRLLLNDITSLRKQIAAALDSSMRQFSTQADALASSTAGLPVNEVLDWRVVLLDQPLRPPS
jgi:hypothetical protein